MSTTSTEIPANRLGLKTEVIPWVTLWRATGHAPIDGWADALKAVEEAYTAIREHGHTPRVPSTADLRREGVPLETVCEVQRERANAAAAHSARRADLEFIQRGLANRLSMALARDRQTALLSIREPLARLVAEARPISQAGHADREAVLRRGDAKALKAGQTFDTLALDFQAYFNAWNASFTAQKANKFDVREIPQSFVYFTTPHVIDDDATAGRARRANGYPANINLTLAAVAATPESAGFRLATVPELVEVLERLRTESRTVFGGRVSTNVIGIGLERGDYFGHGNTEKKLRMRELYPLEGTR